jgi:hypothetical protein
MSEWSHLPNAARIDRILASAKANPKIWSDAWHSTRKAGSDVAWNAAYNAAYYSSCDIANNSDYKPAYEVAAVLDELGTYYTAFYAITALFAYDDAAKYLDLPLDQLKMLYALSEDPAALLLQPAVMAFSMEKELA